MRKLGLGFALIGGCAMALDVEAVIRATYLKPWLEALTSNETAQAKEFLHPKVRACLNAETREYFQAGLADELRGAKGPFSVTRLAPWNGPGPLGFLPEDGFAYTVQPVYELDVLFSQTHTLVTRYLAPANGSWYEVKPCPNEKGAEYIHQALAQDTAHKKQASELVADLKDPLLSEVKAMLRQHSLLDAARKYQQATGLDDLTTAVAVMNLLDPDHPLGKP